MTFDLNELFCGELREGLHRFVGNGWLEGCTDDAFNWGSLMVSWKTENKS